jgi:hypothetical protein
VGIVGGHFCINTKFASNRILEALAELIVEHQLSYTRLPPLISTQWLAPIADKMDRSPRNITSLKNM